MIHEALGRPVPVELTDDRRVRRRVQRLAVVSLVALGLIWALASSTLEEPMVVTSVVTSMLGIGAFLMPGFLAWSLVEPRHRYLLIVPSTLVSLALLAICLGLLPSAPIAAAGWQLMTGGVLLGGALGLWLWFRVLPVPAALDDPYAPGRWLLIGVHVGMIVIGWLLAASVLVS